MVALGGVTAALAVVMMCLTGLIPLATFASPALCMVLLGAMRRMIGSRLGWAWYGAVAILTLLLGPDREAAAIFLFLGWYPLIKPKLDGVPLSWLWKLLLFNAVIALMYACLIRLLGMEALAAEFQELGRFLGAVTLILGNITFLCLDRVLNLRFRRRRRQP